MNIEGVEKKLRAARFALDQMIEQDRMAASKEEQFDLYLSGLLAAGMSIRNAFHVEQDRKRNEAVKKWKSDWEARLSPEERCLWDFMREDRNHEVHRSGSSRKAVTEKREVGAGTYRLKSATVTIAVPPDVRSGIHMQMPTYSFTIAGTERKATESCGEYLALLKQMVAKFKADHDES